MLQFFRLKPMGDNEIGGNYVDPIMARQTRHVIRNRERSHFIEDKYGVHQPSNCDS